MEITPPTTLILSRRDVEQIVAEFGLDGIMDRLTGQLEKVMKAHDESRLTTPQRSGFSYTRPANGLVEWMPIYEHGNQVTIKVVGYHPNNPGNYDLPTIVSTVSAYDTTTGHLTGLMDGVLPTALRTGAASAVASKYLAHPESSVLGIIGCGAQAVTQIHALSRQFKLTEVNIYDVDAEAMRSLVDRCATFSTGLVITPRSIQEVVERADILVTATSIGVGEGPLFDGVTTKEHLHINAIGSDFPGKTECPLSLLQDSYVCPDFLAQALVEGECQRLEADDIGVDIVHLLQHRATYEHLQSRRTVYDSTGWALQDHVTLGLFMKLAAELGLGQRIEIENMSGDASNPYDFALTGAAGDLQLAPLDYTAKPLPLTSE